MVLSGVLSGWILPLVFLLTGEADFYAGHVVGHFAGPVILGGRYKLHHHMTGNCDQNRRDADAFCLPSFEIAENSPRHPANADV